MKDIITISPEISLRRLELIDADELFLLTDENRTYLRQWLPWLDFVNQPEDTKAFIQTTITQYENNLGSQFAIISQNKIIGVIGFHPIDQANHIAEIGYWLAEKCQGRGIITESCKTLIKQAFGSLNINRVQIPAAERNSKSRSIPERLGLKFEGVIRDKENLYGVFVNHAMYSMLKSEYEIKDF